MSHARRTVFASSRVGDSAWEVARRAAPPDLAPYFVELVGYHEQSAGTRRREYPFPGVVVIVDLGMPMRLSLGAERALCHAGGFVAGLDTRFVDTEHDGVQHGIELKLRLRAGVCLFGVPLAALAGQVVGLVDLLPVGVRSLVDRLRGLTTWDARFDVLEHVLRHHLRSDARSPRSLGWAVERVLGSPDGLVVEQLAGALGHSHKHVIALFRAHVGLPPKLLSRVARFDQLTRALKAGPIGSVAALAARLGYFDQAHLARDVRAFAGTTPRSLSAELLPLGALFGERG